MKKLMSKMKSVAVAALTMGLALGAQAKDPSYTIVLSGGKAYANEVNPSYELPAEYHSGLTYADGAWTMNGFQFQTSAATAISVADATTIIVTGDNNMAFATGAVDEDYTVSGLQVKANVEIKGSGVLSVGSAKSYGIYIDTGKALTVSGNVTMLAVGTVGIASMGSLAVTGDAQLTARSNMSKKAYAIQALSQPGATAKTSAGADLIWYSFGNYGTYMNDNGEAVAEAVLTQGVSRFEDGFGRKDFAVDSFTKGQVPTIACHAKDKGYTFSGWFTDSKFTTELTGDPVPGVSYVAKWMKNGATVTTTPINFDTFYFQMTYTNELNGIKWSGEGTAENPGVLTLNGAIIDCSWMSTTNFTKYSYGCGKDQYGYHYVGLWLPEVTTINVTGENGVLSPVGLTKGDGMAIFGIRCGDDGEDGDDEYYGATLTVNGTGKLTVESGAITEGTVKSERMLTGAINVGTLTNNAQLVVSSGDAVNTYTEVDTPQSSSLALDCWKLANNGTITATSGLMKSPEAYGVSMAVYCAGGVLFNTGAIIANANTASTTNFALAASYKDLTMTAGAVIQANDRVVFSSTDESPDAPLPSENATYACVDSGLSKPGEDTIYYYTYTPTDPTKPMFIRAKSAVNRVGVNGTSVTVGSGDGWTYANNVLTLSKAIEYSVYGTDETGTMRIEVTTNAVVTLDDLALPLSGNSDAITFASGATSATLILDGTSKVSAGGGHAAIGVMSNACLTIEGDGALFSGGNAFAVDGKLSVKSGVYDVNVDPGYIAERRIATAQGTDPETYKVDWNYTGLRIDGVDAICGGSDWSICESTGLVTLNAKRDDEDPYVISGQNTRTNLDLGVSVAANGAWVMLSDATISTTAKPAIEINATDVKLIVANSTTNILTAPSGTAALSCPADMSVTIKMPDGGNETYYYDELFTKLTASSIGGEGDVAIGREQYWWHGTGGNITATDGIDVGNLTIRSGFVTASSIYGENKITIEAGTVVADTIEAGTTVDIHGGSVKAGKVTNPISTESDNQSVWCVTVPGISNEVNSISFYSGCSYNTQGMYPIDNALYIWLPNSDEDYPWEFEIGELPLYYAVVANAPTIAYHRYDEGIELYVNGAQVPQYGGDGTGWTYANVGEWGNDYVLTLSPSADTTNSYVITGSEMMGRVRIVVAGSCDVSFTGQLGYDPEYDDYEHGHLFVINEDVAVNVTFSDTTAFNPYPNYEPVCVKSGATANILGSGKIYKLSVATEGSGKVTLDDAAKLDFAVKSEAEAFAALLKGFDPSELREYIVTDSPDNPGFYRVTKKSKGEIIDLGGGLKAQVVGGGCTITGDGTGSGELTDTTALKDKNITNLVVGTGVTGIEAKAFASWRTLRDVTIGADCTSVGALAFGKCHNVTNIVCTATGAVTIGNNAFVGCNSLEALSFEAMPTFEGTPFLFYSGIYMKNGIPEVYAMPTVTITGYEQVLKGSNDLKTWENVDTTTPEGKKAYHFFKIVLEQEY